MKCVYRALYLYENDSEVHFSFFLPITFENFEIDLNLLRVYYFENQKKGRRFHFLPQAPEVHVTPLQNLKTVDVQQYLPSMSDDKIPFKSRFPFKLSRSI